jgi:hypothetical protein
MSIQVAKQEENRVEHEIVRVPTNPNSTVATDISAIFHYEHQEEVCIRLKAGSRCPHPSLVGRLSGQTIAMLNWRKADSAVTNGTSYCGSYAGSWLFPGIYFLEVIIIHCKGFGVTALDRILANPNENHTEEEIQMWRSFDFTHECMEDPASNRLTAEDAFLLVRGHMGGSLGYWALANNANATVQPWFTRYQPSQACSKNENAPECIGPVDNSKISDYSFVWVGEDQWKADIESMKIDLGLQYHQEKKLIMDGSNPDVLYENDIFNRPNKVCLVGDSHTFHMVNAMFRNNLGHHFVKMDLFYPLSVESERLDVWPEKIIANTEYFEEFYFKRNCTQFVIALGQWPLADVYGRFGGPYLVERFRAKMSSIIRNQEIYQIGKGDIKLYLQNMHHSPLGYRYHSCTPKGKPVDWRSFTTTDSYNRVMKELVDETKNDFLDISNRINWIDTQFITTPLWDTAPDWNHLHFKVSDTEALYYARKFLLL